MNGRIAAAVRLGLLCFAPLLSGAAVAQTAAPDIVVTDLPGWNSGLTRVDRGPDGYRVTQNYAGANYSWAELRLTIDVARHPELLIEVDGADAANQWCLKVQPEGGEETWFIPETRENGEFVFPVGEYLDRDGTVPCVLRFFVLGKRGASVRIKRLELRGGGARGVAERVEIDENLPRQRADGAGGQADYPLWVIGAITDKVTPREIGGLLDQLKTAGISVARVGAYGEVFQQATDNPEDGTLAGLVRHLGALKKRNIRSLFVCWSPPPATRAKPAKSDEWLRSFVDQTATFLAHCEANGASVAYFELQNEPHANPQWWDPEFLGRCGAALADELKKRKLPVEVIGPDVPHDDAWAVPWARTLSDKRANIIALKAGAHLRGTPQDTARATARVIGRVRQATGLDPRFWLTEYGSWAWGNPDADRRPKDGPADGHRYGRAMAELTHYYLKAGISCPSIWELYDVRRVEEIAGKPSPQDPKRWGMFKYKTEDWAKRAHFATLGHYFRALAPGAWVFESRSSGALLPTAVKQVSGGWDIVLFNRLRQSRSATVRLPKGDWGTTALWCVTDEADPLRVTPVILAADGVMATVTVPPYGVGSLLLRPGGRNLVAPTYPKSVPGAEESRAAPPPAEVTPGRRTAPSRRRGAAPRGSRRFAPARSSRS